MINIPLSLSNLSLSLSKPSFYKKQSNSKIKIKAIRGNNTPTNKDDKDDLMIREFTNKNKYYVPSELENQFKLEISQRERKMKKCEGYISTKISKLDPYRYEIISTWSSIPHWETWSTSIAARRSHLSPGIYQYVPKRGEGFPEDFTPFKDFYYAVEAKYIK